MSQMYNPYIGQVPGQQLSTQQTWLLNNQNLNLPYTTPAPKQTIFGKIVQNESQITPNDVPMDGTIALFRFRIFPRSLQSSGLPTVLFRLLSICLLMLRTTILQSLLMM